jgi:phosphopantetheinyl transferase
MGEWRRKSFGRVEGNSSEESRARGEAIKCDRARSSSSGGRGALWANLGAWGGAELDEHHMGRGEQEQPNSGGAKLTTVRRE